MLYQRVARNDNTGGVCARVAGDAFQFPRRLEEPLHLRVGIDGVAHLLVLFQRVAELDMQLVRHQARNLVGVAVAHAEGAANVADRRLRAKRSKRDDLGDAVVTVVVVGELDHLVPPVVREVEVDVGHLAPFEVEEAFEHKAVRNRLDIRNVEHVQYERRRRRTAHAHANARPAGEIGDLLDHVDVVREPRLLEHVQLVHQPLLQLTGYVGEAAVQPLHAEFGEVLRAVATLGDRGRREELAVELQLQFALIGDHLGVRDELRVVREDLAHLVFARQVVAVPVELVAVLLVHGGVGADAKERVVGLRFVRHRVVAIVRGDNLYPQVATEFRDHWVQLRELGVAVVLHFEVVVIVEDLAVPFRRGDSAVAVTLLDAPMELR